MAITIVETPQPPAGQDGTRQPGPAVQLTSTPPVNKSPAPAPWSSSKVIATAAVVLLGAFLVGALSYAAFDPVAPVVDGSLNVFALLFVLALVIERVLQPFARWLGPDTDALKEALRLLQETADREAKAAAEMLKGDKRGSIDLEKTAKGIAEAVSALGTGRDQTGVVAWAAASALGVVLSGTLGIGILDVVLASGAPAFPVDMAITGMVIGAGTKPLNDLWTRLQNKPTS